VELPTSATVKDLKQAYKRICKKSYHRISFKVGNERLDDDGKTLESYGIKDGAVVAFKDLGPQIGYRTVFLGMHSYPNLSVISSLFIDCIKLKLNFTHVY
jgi:very-long-chain enoyl-CoA reductase